MGGQDQDMEDMFEDDGTADSPRMRLESDADRGVPAAQAAAAALDAQREEKKKWLRKRNVIARSLEESGLKPPGGGSEKDSQELDEFLEDRDKVKKPRNIDRDY